MSLEVNQNILMMGLLFEHLFDTSLNQRLELALREDMIAMFSGCKNDSSAQVYFSKFNSLKSHVCQLMMVQCIRNGERPSSVANKFGVSVQEVYRTIKKHGCKPKKENRLVNGFAFYHKTVEHELIRLMHSDGVPVKKISSKKMVSEDTVKQILRIN